MKKKTKLKLFLYNFLNTRFGRSVLRLLSFGVRVKNLEENDNQKNHPFLIILTIDTESGYVGTNERRVWQKEDPKAFMGYYYGIRNLVNIFEKCKLKATFFLSTQSFSSKGYEYRRIIKELTHIFKKGHEIGLHLHPDSDFSLQKKISKNFEATSAFFYDYNEKLEMISAAKELLELHLGKSVVKKLTSFRWGNWALDSEGAKALNELGFSIDSSATPGIRGHSYDGMKYDWSKVKLHYPWKLSTTNYQAISHNNSDIAEIPIATFDFFGIKLRADPVNSILLNEAFLQYYKKADRSKKPFPFVIITHSSEATTKTGETTKALKDLEMFILTATEYDNVEFVTLQEAYKRLKIDK